MRMESVVARTAAARVRIALATYRPEEGAESLDRDLPVLRAALEGAGARPSSGTGTIRTSTGRPSTSW
jgi:hypothetical protein